MGIIEGLGLGIIEGFGFIQGFIQGFMCRDGCEGHDLNWGDGWGGDRLGLSWCMWCPWIVGVCGCVGVLLCDWLLDTSLLLHVPLGIGASAHHSSVQWLCVWEALGDKSPLSIVLVVSIGSGSHQASSLLSLSLSLAVSGPGSAMVGRAEPGFIVVVVVFVAGSVVVVVHVVVVFVSLS